MYREPLVIDVEDGDRKYSLNRLLWANGLGYGRVTGSPWRMALDGREIPRWSRLYVWPFTSMIVTEKVPPTCGFDIFCQTR